MSYASNPAYIGRGLTVDGELLSRDDAERAVAGNLSASDITRIAVPGDRRLSAIPGGGIPYEVSDFGYVWYSLGNGEYYADSRDGSITLGIDVNAPGGQVFWQAEDDLGVVEEGNFSGMDRRDIKLVLQRADRQLSQLDSFASVKPKSREYQDDYTEQFPVDWRSPLFQY